jgi:Poly(R)-hydroxyalkanoic acid synthase subunit (PHA_synth_III_E)
MSNTAMPDPNEMWRRFVSEWEKAVNDFAHQAMSTKDFGRSMNQFAGASVDFQKSFGTIVARYLASLNLPSQTEMVEIGERLQAIDERLEQIAATLNNLTGTRSGPITSARPVRTRRPQTSSSQDPGTAA